MNIILIILQVGLALHTAMGAIWKIMNPMALAPMFPMIPVGLWGVISFVELVATVFLVVPLIKKSHTKLAVIGASLVALEMVSYTGIYLASGTANYGPIYYWLVVAVISGFIAYQRR